MKLMLKSLVIALCCVLCFSPFSVFAEESGNSSRALDGSNYTLNAVQQAKFDELISTLPNYSNAAIWYNSTEKSLAWTYSISYNASTSVATFTTRYQMRQDGSIQTQTSSTTNNIYDNTIVHYYVFKYNGVYITGENYIPSSPPVYPNIACPVALNDVLANDYVTSLLMYLYRVGVDQFIIYRLQETFDTSTLLNSLEVQQVGEFKGYILTTPNNTVQTFVYEYNRPTIISPDNGNTWTYQYLNILDPGYASDWEMVLHYTCLDSRYGSEFEAIENLNNSIQSTIQQNATLISQNSQSLSNQSTMIGQNNQLIQNQQQTNNLITDGTSSSQSVSNSILDTNSSLNAAVNQYDQAEKAFTDDFKTNVDSIETNFSWGTQFLNSANFVRTTFNELVEPAPIYNMVLFSLILGFALFIIGRLR